MPPGFGARLITYSLSGTVVKPDAPNTRNKGRPNVVTTTKFTPFTWLPKSLYLQFQRIANIYFLFIAIIVCFPWSPKSWKSKVIPFLGVLLWTALKDLYEDQLRRRGDRQENEQTCARFDQGSNTFVEVHWKDILVGDLLFIPCDSSFPADLILLQATGGDESFISTVNLDGETNLKERRAPPLAIKIREDEEAILQTYPSTASRKMGRTRSSLGSGGDVQAKSKKEVGAIVKVLLCQGLSVEMSEPECGLADVRGTFNVGSEQCPIGEMNFMPRGCVLRNTVWALTIVAYAGDETKTRLNAIMSNAKVSNMQVNLNLSVRGLLGCILITNAYCATMATVNGDDDSWPIKFLMFCITLYHVVPISLYVMFEVLKLFLGYHVNTDKQMEDPDTQQMAVARTADLMEEMGQIDFVFSDKTGTLTANEMVFARCSIDGEDLGDFRTTSTVRDGTANVKRILHAPDDASYQAVDMFFICLATCHAVQVETTQVKGGASRLHYSGMSPDEVALVQAAADVDLVMEERFKSPGDSSSMIVVKDASGLRRSFKILHELEFNSDRKRMSVLLEHEGEIWCVTKGADNVMIDLLNQDLDGKTHDNLQKFSKQGLRTLVVAFKKVTRGDYGEWETEFRAAQNIVDNTRNEKVDKVSAQMEIGLQFVGVTAVEDRLQDGVPQAIATMKDAGVRLWVLTGDKTETAVDIARSCAIFTSTTRIAYATGADSIEKAQQFLREAKTHLECAADGGLVLDGRTVKFALEDQDSRALVYELGLASRSCVCCRLSPMQKRQLVRLVREMSPSTITLAIGDGANDVPMIQGAHLGIGIRGKEGTQAVQVSDIAISQFRFLVPLLLCHGRRAYRRVACFLCYFLYKNVCLVVSDIIWAHQNVFSGRIAYPEYLSMGFNAIFTAWHVIFLLCFDEDVPDRVANSTPSLYLVGPQRALFNMWIFGEWMAYALWHGAVAWLIPNLWFGGDRYSQVCDDDVLDKVGRQDALCWKDKETLVADDDYDLAQEFWLGSITSFTLVLVIVYLRLLLVAQSPFNKWSLGTTLACLASYIIYLLCLSEVEFMQSMQPTVKGLAVEFFKSGQCLGAVGLGVVIALTPDVLEKFVRYRFFPTELDKARARMHNTTRPGAGSVSPNIYGKLTEAESGHSANAETDTIESVSPQVQLGSPASCCPWSAAQCMVRWVLR